MQTASIPPAPAVAAILARPALTPVHPTLVSEVSLEPAEPGVIRRGLHHVPLLNHLGKHTYKSGEQFSPARPVHEFKPLITNQAVEAEVDVRIWIDETGQVTKSELLSGNAQPEIAHIASTAANKWTFQPARIADHPVSSEVVMHFRFVPKQTY